MTTSKGDIPGEYPAISVRGPTFNPGTLIYSTHS
jgi:hypothetical protein